MNILSVTGMGSAIAGKTGYARLASEEVEGEVQFVDSVWAETRLPAIGTSPGVRNYLSNKEMREQVNKVLKFTTAAPVSVLYGMWNGSKFSDWMEICYSGRFMAGNVGPDLGFVTGAGVSLPSVDVEQAVPQLARVRELLASLDYKGEIKLGVAEGFSLCYMDFGHMPGLFAMYQEVAKGSVEGVLKFLAGEADTCQLHEALVVSNMVSKLPFPVATTSGQLKAPPSAEKHLWRIPLAGGEVVYALAHGTSVKELKNRVYSTIRNMLNYDKSLQYRVDAAHKVTFILASSQWEAASGKPS